MFICHHSVLLSVDGMQLPLFLKSVCTYVREERLSFRVENDLKLYKVTCAFKNIFIALTKSSVACYWSSFSKIQSSLLDWEENPPFSQF